MFRCHSSGFSLLTKDGKSFWWAAIAGRWQPYVNGGTPRDFGPCGDVLDCNAPMLFSRWEKRYPYLVAATPTAEEGLLLPFAVAGKAVGTLWVIAHDKQRKFDAEDLRLLESLGQFASRAYTVLQALDNAREQARQLAQQNRMLLERMRSERPLSDRAFALAFIESESGILERLARGAPLQTVLETLVLAIQSQSDGMLGSALLLSDDGRIKHGAAPSLPRAYVNAIDGVKIGPAAGSCGTAMHLGKPVVSADIATDPLWRDYRKLALDHGLRACWSAPIVSPQKEVLGAFALYYREPRRPQARERHLVEVGAQLAAIAIGAASAQALASSPAVGPAMLSAREVQVMHLIVRGEPIKRIAGSLNMSPSTVYTHRARIFEKLGIDSNVRLFRYALDRRMVP